MCEPRPLPEVFEAAGGIAALADKIGVDRTTPYTWRQVPPHHVRRISQVTGIPKHELRPDLYEPPASERVA